MGKLIEMTKLVLYAAAGAAGYRSYLRHCREQGEFTVKTTPDMLRAAHQLKGWLDGTGQTVVVLARRGQNLQRHGVTYSHAAYALFDEEVQAWRVHHLLNPQAWKKSAIQVHSLLEFLSDNLYALDVAAVIPEPAIQLNLYAILKSEVKRCALHHPRYSAIAYPYCTRYQNSNGWLLENFAFAADRAANATRAQAQAWLQAHSYAPSVIEVNPLTVARAKLFWENMEFDDHPPHLLQDNKVTLHTGDSVLAFIRGYASQKSGGDSNPDHVPWCHQLFELPSPPHSGKATSRKSKGPMNVKFI